MNRKLLSLLLCALLTVSAGGAIAERFSILLLGTDKTETSQNAPYGLADAIVAMSVNLEDGTVRMAALDRDIPSGMNGAPRLCDTAALGGPEATLAIVNQLCGLAISNYVAIDLNTSAPLIDALGGVDVRLDESVAALCGVQPGVVRLTGAQAQALMQSGEASVRAPRQRQILLACMSRLQSLGMDGMASALPAVLSSVQTNMGLGDILSLATVAFTAGLRPPEQKIFSACGPEVGNFLME